MSNIKHDSFIGEDKDLWIHFFETMKFVAIYKKFIDVNFNFFFSSTKKWIYVMIMKFFLWYSWPTKSKRFSLFPSRSMSEVLNIANLRHATSRVWTCPESDFRSSWMKMCNTDNHYTTIPRHLSLSYSWNCLETLSTISEAKLNKPLTIYLLIVNGSKISNKNFASRYMFVRQVKLVRNVESHQYIFYVFYT